MSSQVPEFQKEFLDQYLYDYYLNLFPAKLFMKWLSYGKPPNEYLSHREFAFTFVSDGATRMHRKLAFTDTNEFVKELARRKPQKFEIGAVAELPLFHANSVPASEWKWSERELTFDIDMDDYNEYRTCCTDKRICQKCWSFISLAAKVLNHILSKTFGFKKMLFVFSGRRGLHVWVADKVARELCNEDRRAVSDYISAGRGIKFRRNKVDKVFVDSCRIILDAPETTDLVVDQGWMEDRKIDEWLKKCPDRRLESHIRTAFKKMNDPAGRFEALKCMCDPKSHNESGTRLQAPSQEAVAFFYMFLVDRMHPKLDAEITKKVYHLLKAPFCVHPDTGMIAVPISPNTAHLIKLENIPRVDQLIKQYKKAKADQEEADKENPRKILYYRRTNLASYIENFEVFINDAVKDA